jgi:predicted thioesterase
MKEGLSHTSHLIVSQSDTALSQGSGDMEVLATPRMIALMENAAMLAVAPALAPGETSVGGQISITHLKPSAVGAEVSATAVLTQVEGRKLTFTLSASEGDKRIGEGTHIRFIVNREKFLGSLA